MSWDEVIVLCLCLSLVLVLIARNEMTRPQREVKSRIQELKATTQDSADRSSRSRVHVSIMDSELNAVRGLAYSQHILKNRADGLMPF